MDILMPTTVVGSLPQPNWLVNREVMLSRHPPRVRLNTIWRVSEPFLEEAQDDATVQAVREQEAAGLDIVSDGEIRRESYFNRFATALDGIDIDNPAEVEGRNKTLQIVPRVIACNVSRSHLWPGSPSILACHIMYTCCSEIDTGDSCTVTSKRCAT